MAHGRKRRGDDVADIGEITRLLYMSVNGDGFFLQKRPDEPVERHIGTLARSIHRKVAQRDRRHALLLGVDLAEVLAREFCHAVRRKRQKVAVFARWFHRYLSIYR